MNYNKKFSGSKIRTVIIIALAFIASAQIISTIPNLYHGFKQYNQLKNAIFFNDITDDLFRSVNNLAFERGRFNAILNDSSTLKEMDTNIKFAYKSRQDGNAALNLAISKIAGYNNSLFSKSLTEIESKLEEINRLRKEVDRNINLPLDQRDKTLGTKWFSSTTELINEIFKILLTVTQNINDFDARVARYSNIKLELLSLRNVVGPQMSIISAMMTSVKPASPEIYKTIERLSIESEVQMKFLKQQSVILHDTKITDSFDKMNRDYYKEFIPKRDLVFHSIKTGEPFPINKNEFISYNVKALNSIASFMDTIITITGEYATKHFNDLKDLIAIQIIIMLSSLVLIFIIFLLVNYRILKPLSGITDIMLRLASNDLDAVVPYKEKTDEIGDMARAAAFFKGNALLLKKEIEEREELIIKLQEASKEIENLREIFPICSFCKKIRDDKGYWEQLETYMHKNSQIDFSHSICPDCLKKNYPDMYERLKEDDEIE